MREAELEGGAFGSQSAHGESRPLHLCDDLAAGGLQIVATLGWAMTSP